MAGIKYHRKRELSFEDKMKIISKPTWTCRDVVEYFDICDNNAYKLLEEIKTEHGHAPYNQFGVLAKHVLSKYNTTREEEMRILIYAVRYEKELMRTYEIG